MSEQEQDPTSEAGHQSDMPTTVEENDSINCKTNLDDLTKNLEGGLKNCDLSEEKTSNDETCNDLPELSSTKKCDELIELSDGKNCDGLTEPCVGTENHEGLIETADGGPTEPPDGPGDEVECGEIPSPKVPEEVKPFAVECELDFEAATEHSALLSPPSSISSKKTKETPADGEDDGECSDEVDEEEDLEEGELKDEIVPSLALENNATTKINAPTKTVCRFFSRGLCFYGNNCRFLHVTCGNYSMFGPPRAGFAEAYEQTAVPLGNMTHAMMNHRAGPPRTGPEFSPNPPLHSQTSSSQPAALESAWERGLREAKELVKRANKRKVEEPDFEEKRLNLSLVVNEKNIFSPDREREQLENEPPPYKKKKNSSLFPKREYDPHDVYDDRYDNRQEHWREGHFDNMEIRYQHTHHKEEHRDRGRSRMDRERERDKFPKSPERNKFLNNRLEEVQLSRSRNDDYFDPWRRSKSPKGNIRRTRSRSGSYSSVSSYSDRSSSSYSRSSSRSSSRSPHPHVKQTPSPTVANPPFVSPKLGPNKFTTMKKKPGGRTPSPVSRSRSRSFSRSISMDSVSSASSSISRSSHSDPNSHGSILRKQENPTVDQKPDPAMIVAAPNPPAIPLSSVYLNYNAPNRECKVEKTKDTPKEPPPIADDDERDPLEEKFLTPLDVPFPSLQHLLPTSDKAKDTFKSAPHKQQIKLTLLNKKNPKLNNLPKKELDVNRKQIDEPSAGVFVGVKSPLSPPIVHAKITPVLVPKKSASSRRDELLKQLKAVEDAIARKRAKFG